MEEEKKTNEGFSSDNVLSDEQLERVAGGSKPVYTYCRVCKNAMDGELYKCTSCGSTNVYISSGLD